MVHISKSAEVRLREAAQEVAWITVVLRDGRTLEGCALYNSLRDTVALINPIRETRHDFCCSAVQEVKVGNDPRCIDLIGESTGIPRLALYEADDCDPRLINLG